MVQCPLKLWANFSKTYMGTFSKILECECPQNLLQNGKEGGHCEYIKPKRNLLKTKNSIKQTGGGPFDLKQLDENEEVIVASCCMRDGSSSYRNCRGLSIWQYQ